MIETLSQVFECCALMTDARSEDKRIRKSIECRKQILDRGAHHGANRTDLVTARLLVEFGDLVGEGIRDSAVIVIQHRGLQTNAFLV